MACPQRRGKEHIPLQEHKSTPSAVGSMGRVNERSNVPTKQFRVNYRGTR